MSVAISVIVVNWNGKKLIGDCLDSLKAQTFRDFEIILVDNGSTDDSLLFVEAMYPEVITLGVSKNLGFAGGNNLGIMAAEGKYIALLNNDARAERDWLHNLYCLAEAFPRVGMFASKVILPSGKIDSAGVMLYPDGVGICRGRGKDKNACNRFFWPDFPSGCAAMYRAEMLNEIGLFDDSFFMYCEDVDLGIRARKAIWPCLYVPTAIVTHLYSQSACSLKKLFYVERNRLKVMFNNFTWGEILCSFPYTFSRYFRMAFKGVEWSV